MNYKFEKEETQNRQLVWKPKIKNSIKTFDQRRVPMKVNLGWTNPHTMQQFCLGIRRSYRLIPLVVIAKRMKDHEKVMQARTRDT